MDYMNEFDPFAAQWLQNLVDAGEIPQANIDTRSIKSVQPNELAQYQQCHFFAGIGGWPLALQLAGWPESVPVWTGSCPCQPFSTAGKRTGEADERHLWPDFFRLINACRPAIVFGEQVASNDGLRWLDGVFADLEGAGYSSAAADLCAPSGGEEADIEIYDELSGEVVYTGKGVVGAPHIRQRLYWLAYASESRYTRSGSRAALDPDRTNSVPQRGHPFIESSGGSPISGLADLHGDGRETGRVAAERDGHRDSTHANGGAVGMGNADSIGQGSFGRVCEGERTDTTGSINRLANPDQSELRGQSPTGKQPIDEQDNGIGRVGYPSVSTGERNTRSILGAKTQSSCERFIDGDNHLRLADASPWDDYRIIPCRDGKARRICAQPGVQPLAHGIPTKRSDPRMGFMLTELGKLGHSPKAAKRILRQASKNKNGRLRGYGNAINPQVAAKFIRVIMEVLSPNTNQGEENGSAI